MITCSHKYCRNFQSKWSLQSVRVKNTYVMCGKYQGAYSFIYTYICTYLFIIYTTLSLLFTEKLISELNFKATKQAELYTKLENWPKTNGAYRQLLNDK